MARRTTVQLALLITGLIVWAYGQRTDDKRLTYIGLGFFAVAFVLRLFKPRRAMEPPEPTEPPDA